MVLGSKMLDGGREGQSAEAYVDGQGKVRRPLQDFGFSSDSISCLELFTGLSFVFRAISLVLGAFHPAQFRLKCLPKP